MSSKNIPNILLLVLSCLGYFQSGARGTEAGNDLQKPYFLENSGQLTDQFHHNVPGIKFRLKTPGLSVFLGQGLIQYQWDRKINTRVGDSTVVQTEMYAMQVNLLGANKDAEIIREESAGYYENYYLPQCPAGVTAQSYRKVTYKNIYPNIDWVLYIGAEGKSDIKNQTSQFKYDFVVHPGGNAQDIKMQYSGDSALVLKDGGITAYTSFGSIAEDAPYAYEQETQKPVGVSFVQDGDLIGFSVAEYAGDLVIDPSVRWATFFGGTYNEQGNAVAAQHGFGTFYRTYMAGNAESFDIFMSPGAHQPLKSEVYTNSDRYDGFIAAYSFSGRREWATYFGGNDHDYIRGAVCDKAGNIIVAGGTKSDTGISTFPSSTLQPDPVYLASLMTDGFIAKFDSNGKRIWGRYTGGESWDDISAIATDASDNLYITGRTYSASGIGTAGTFKQTPPGALDAFIEKYNSNGVKLWGSYYGDNVNDYGNALVCDYSGNVYLAGNTVDDTCENIAATSPDTAIASLNAYQLWPGNISLGCPMPVLPLPPPMWDGFLAKFNGTDGTRLWGTYYGNSTGDDYINALAFDSTGFIDIDGKTVKGLVYIGGTTQSIRGIASSGGWDTTTTAAHGLSTDGFIAAFRPDGTRFWSTYLGGTESENIYGMQVDRHGALHVVGSVSSPGMSIPAFLGNPPAGVHGFHAVFCQSAMQSFAYIAGNKPDRCNAVVSNDIDQAYIVGSSMSDSGISYQGLFSPQQLTNNSNTGNTDAFLITYDNDMPIEFTYGVPPGSSFGNFCPEVDYIGTFFIRLLNDMGIVFQPGNQFTAQLSDATGSFENATTVGTGTTATNVHFTVPKTLPSGNGYRFRFLSTRPAMISRSFGCMVNKFPHPKGTVNSPLCAGDTLWLRGADTTTGAIIDGFRWEGPGFSVFIKDTFRANVTTAESGTYLFKSISNYICAAFDTINVAVKPRPQILSIGNTGPVCEGENISLIIDADTAGGGVFTWTGPSFSSVTQNPVLTAVNVSNAGKYYARFTKYGCFVSDSTIVKIDTLPPKPDIFTNSPVCYGETIMLGIHNPAPATSYLWTGPSGFSSTLTGHYIPASTEKNSGTYTMTARKDKCFTTDSVEILVKPPLAPLDVTSNSPIKAGEELHLFANGPVGAIYSWVGPDSFSSNDQNPVVKFLPYSGTGQYKVSANIDGCTTSGSVVVVVNTTSEVFFVLFPNPNDGNFTIKATLNNDQVVPLVIVNAVGQRVYEQKLVSNKRLLVAPVSLPGYLSNGDYYLRIRTDGRDKIVPFAISR